MNSKILLDLPHVYETSNPIGLRVPGDSDCCLGSSLVSPTVGGALLGSNPLDFESSEGAVPSDSTEDAFVLASPLAFTSRSIEPNLVEPVCEVECDLLNTVSPLFNSTN